MDDGFTPARYMAILQNPTAYTMAEQGAANMWAEWMEEQTVLEATLITGCDQPNSITAEDAEALGRFFVEGSDTLHESTSTNPTAPTKDHNSHEE